MSHHRLLDVIEGVYDAGAGSTCWNSVVKRLNRLVGAQSAFLMIESSDPGETELLYAAEFPRDAVLAYQQHYRSVDLWTTRAARATRATLSKARPKVWISGHLVPDREFVHSEFYSDFGRKLGLRHVVGTVLQLDGARSTAIGLHRPDGAAPFERAEAHYLECLLPHLRRALQMRRHLSGAPVSGLAGLAALDAIALGVLVVDADMRLLVANVAADAMIAGRAALGMRREAGGDANGKLVVSAVNGTDGLALAALVRSTALGGSPGGGVLLHDAHAEPALAAMVGPLPRRLTEASRQEHGRIAGQALILLRDLSAKPAPPPADLLRDLFHLTRAEAEIARALAGGATKESVAAVRGIRASTVRTQVRAILEKTGAANLRDLERLLGHLAP